MPKAGMLGRSTDGISSRLVLSTLSSVLMTNSVTPSGIQTKSPARNHLRRTRPTFLFMEERAARARRSRRQTAADADFFLPLGSALASVFDSLFAAQPGFSQPDGAQA